MRMEKLGENSVFVFLPEFEPVWAALSLLTGEKVHRLCTEIYGAETIAGLRRRYNFLFECFQAVENNHALNMPDFLLDLPLESVSLEDYRDDLLHLPPEDFLWRYLELDFCPEADRNTLRRALTEDSALDAVYGWRQEGQGSFLAFSAFIRQSRRFITDFFALALELRTPELEKALSSRSAQAERLLQAVRSGVESLGPLACAEEQMGKTFRNRGPYEEFFFLPAFLMPARAVRYFHVKGEHKRQILFLTLRDTGRSREDKVKALKALADSTRYQIVTLLARQGPMRGLDIAKEVSLAASTVSHHMEQLKDCGLVTEEQVKNAKYYGLSRNGAAQLLEELKKDFQNE